VRALVLTGVAVLAASAAALGAGETRHVLSLSASAQDVVVGEPVKFEGELTRETGAPESGTRVLLQADAFPFERWRTVARERTDSRGAFSFTRRPRRNTRYRAIAQTNEPTVTRGLTVYADFRGGVRSFKVDEGEATVRVFLDVPSYGRLPSRRVHVYVFHRERPRGRHVGSAVLERVSRRRWAASVQFTADGLTRKNYAGMCIRETEQDGWGRLRSIDRHCGERFVRK
jgi:hypothetical protein